MSGTQRTVHHLHLTAPSRAQAQALLPRLEDALRCASLPDDGARLLVLRRLALGRLRHDIGTTALARLIEQRVAEAEGVWVDAETPAAASADGVVFASALDARIALALRLLRGQPAIEWYWPLAVPEAHPALAPVDRLRCIARAMAAWPEARAALPAWAAALVQGGVGERLAAVIAPAEGEAWLQAAGRAARPGAGAAEAARAGPPVGPDRAGRAADARSATARLPVWLQSLLTLPAVPGARTPVAPGVRPTAADLVPRRADADTADTAMRQRIEPSHATPAPAPARRDDPTAPASDPGDAMLPRDFTPGRPAAAPGRSIADRPDAPAGASLPARPAGLAAAPGDPAAGSSWAEGGAATAAGGLLFLLPLLARLGLPGWRQDVGDAPAFTAAVLGVALHRLRTDADDPAWSLALPPGAAAMLPRGAAPPPASWLDDRLAPRFGRPGAMARRLAEAPDAPAQAALWLDACRRWLRRIGGIGLVSLVRRPGRLALTATHADLFFRLDQTDLRVRRLGLDIDPLWLPWFGRVVAFHYRQGPR